MNSTVFDAVTSFIWKHLGVCMIAIMGLFLLVCTLLFQFTRQQSEEKTVAQSVASAKNIIDQFKSLRGYYAKNVVSKAKKNGMSIAIDHADNPAAIPLPATMIHELSEAFQKNADGIQLELYSAYPFPNRKDRALDSFAKQALQAVEQNPESPFVSVEDQQVRVAIADKMVGQSCVTCHNAHPDTPKSDCGLSAMFVAFSRSPCHFTVRWKPTMP